MYDPGKDFVRQHEQQLRRQAQEQLDTSDRPWEHQDNKLLRRRYNLRQALILLGVVAVLVVALMVLFGLNAPPADA